MSDIMPLVMYAHTIFATPLCLDFLSFQVMYLITQAGRMWSAQPVITLFNYTNKIHMYLDT